MATVMLAVRKTTTDALTTISASTTAITHAANSIAALAETGALHAEHHRNVTKRRLELTEEEYEDIAERQAKMKIARAVLTIEQELKEDPELEAIYNSIYFTPKAAPVAA